VTGPRGLGHIVAGILYVLDWTNVGSIPLAIVGASKRLTSDIYGKWTIVNYGRLSCNKIQVEFIIYLPVCILIPGEAMAPPRGDRRQRVQSSLYTNNGGETCRVCDVEPRRGEHPCTGRPSVRQDI